MFRKRIGDQSESKIDSDKVPAKKDQARFAGPLRGAFWPLYVVEDSCASLLISVSLDIMIGI